MRKLRNYALICLLLGCLLGCSESDPDITQITISDENPVAGQRVLLQVYANTDNYPMHYVWTYSVGTLYNSSGEQIVSGELTDNYGVFLRVPGDLSEVTATVINCTIIDSEDNQASMDFQITMSPRGEPEEVYSGVKGIVKDTASNCRGIWVQRESGNIEYLSATENSDSGWGSAYTASANAILVYAYQYYYYSYVSYWMGTGSYLINLLSSNETTYSLPDGCGGVTSLALFSSVLWVGTNNGLYPFSVSYGTFGDQVASVTDAVRQLYYGDDMFFVATSTGISYTEDASTWVTPSALQADMISVVDAYMDSGANHYILGLKSDSSTLYTYNLTDSSDATIDLSATDYLGNSLDKDLDNMPWCGSRRLNDSGGWDDKPFSTVIANIDKTVISTEGMYYFLTEGGVLWVWGKKP